MGTRNEKPVRMAIHPGAILKEELRERKIKQRELAQIIGMQPSHLSEIIRGKRHITKSIADKLEDVLSIPSIDWMRLQLAYDYDMVGVPRETGRIEPVHPGKIIKAEVDRRNISLSALSQETGISSYQINELLAERMKLETDLAMMLEAAIGLDASWLMTIQNEYDILMAQRDASFMERIRQIRQIAAAL